MERQLDLYAAYAPSQMVSFLRGRPFVRNEHALKICQQHEPQLTDAMVHLLDRMGKHEEALNLIVDELGDIKRAVDFVHQVRDPEEDRRLWDLLIRKSLEKAEFVSELLENAGGHIINPAKLIEQVPLLRCNTTLLIGLCVAHVVLTPPPSSPGSLADS